MARVFGGPLFTRAPRHRLSCYVLAHSAAGDDVIRDQRVHQRDQLSSALRAQLAERLPAYMIPRNFFFLDTFPMNVNGKADRRKLAEMLA